MSLFLREEVRDATSAESTCPRSFFAEHSESVITHLGSLFVSKAIDTDRLPFSQEGAGIEDHKGQGLLLWEKQKFNDPCFLLRIQSDADYSVEDIILLTENKKPMNAAVLDWLLQHPKQIPVRWKGKKILFPGTTYMGSSGVQHIRYLDYQASSVSGCITSLGARFDMTWYIAML